MDRFLGPGGWSDDPRGAKILLRSSARKNEFFAAEGGQWVPADEGAREKALLWVLRSARGGFCFTGLLAVDEEMESALLVGIDFEMVSETEFLVSAEESAREFVRRVRKAGGQVQKGLAVPEPPVSLKKDGGDKAKIAKMMEQDAKALRAVERGDRSAVADFEARGPEIRSLVEESRQSGGPGFENELMLRAGAEERMRVLLGEAPGGESSVLPSLLQQLQLLWQEAGIDAEWNGREVHVSLPEGVVALGSEVSFRPSGESSEPSKKA